MPAIQVPDQPDVAEVTLTVTTGRKEAKANGTEPITKNFPARLPKNIGSAIALLGEKDVFSYFIQAYVVKLQGEERLKLQPQVEGKARKKAAYLESVGL